MYLLIVLVPISIINGACFKGITIVTLTRETQLARTHALILYTSGLLA
jgi:hypothetical protein